MSRDPISAFENSGLNLYTAFDNAPTEALDLLGLSSWEINESPRRVRDLKPWPFGGTLIQHLDTIAEYPDNTAAATTLKLSCKVKCRKQSAGWFINESQIKYRPVIHFRPRYYLDDAKESAVITRLTRIEMEHVRDFNNWANVEGRVDMDIFDVDHEGDCFTTQSKCETTLTDLAKAELTKSANGALQTTIDRLDYEGGPHDLHFK